MLSRRALLVALLIVGTTGCSARDPVLPQYVEPDWVKSNPSKTPSTALLGQPSRDRSPTTQNQPNSDTHPATDPAAARPSAGTDAPEVHVASELPLPSPASTRKRPYDDQPIVILDTLLQRAPIRAPGARVNNRGTVRAIVMPVALGKAPTWDEAGIGETIFGPDGLPFMLYQESRGQFKLEVDIFPPLVDRSVTEADVTTHRGADRRLKKLARRVVDEWSVRANLAIYDSDGPDGRPMSGDDDGAIDLIYLLLETSSLPALMSVPIHHEVRVGRFGRITAKVPEVHILALPPKGSPDPVVASPKVRLLQALHYLGVQPNLAYFPAPHDTILATSTRLMLGWSPYAEVRKPGFYYLSNPDAIVMLPSGKDRYWLLERRSGTLFASDAIRRKNQYFTMGLRLHRPGDPPLVLPLGDGKSPPTAVIEWSGRRDPMSITVYPRGSRQ